MLTSLLMSLGRLGAARGSLASTGALEATLRAGHRARQTLDIARNEPHRDTVNVDLTAPGTLAQLQEQKRQHREEKATKSRTNSKPQQAEKGSMSRQTKGPSETDDRNKKRLNQNPKARGRKQRTT